MPATVLTPIRRDALEAATGGRAVAVAWLAAGNNAELHTVTLDDGRRVVTKTGAAGARLDLEGAMLRHLAAHSSLPVPAVFHAEPRFLVMDHIPGGGRLDADAQGHAAERLAALHAVTAPAYGFPWDTLIGPLPQPNPPTADWIAFFRDARLLPMARAALAEGALDTALMVRIERLAARLPEWIGQPAPPSLIHGDLWGGNILAEGGRISGFLDPAIYHADPEIELAFSTLFGTFAEPFFRRYAEIRPMRPGFFEVRRDLYNLYPLLVHVRLFGGAYVAQVERIIRRFTA